MKVSKKSQKVVSQKIKYIKSPSALSRNVIIQDSSRFSLLLFFNNSVILFYINSLALYVSLVWVYFIATENDYEANGLDHIFSQNHLQPSQKYDSTSIVHGNGKYSLHVFSYNLPTASPWQFNLRR